MTRIKEKEVNLELRIKTDNMIQRIQTIWLLISAISSGLLIKVGIIDFINKAGHRYFIGFSGISKLNETGHELITRSVPLEIFIILIPLLSVISILCFKSRRSQKILTLIVITFSICLIILVGYYSIFLMNNYNADFVPGIKIFFPLIIPVSAVLAYKGISKDENLINSYDRLR
jgi:glucan phosphoethanolaminetransferase (alkaline phosphatase superfamily)